MKTDKDKDKSGVAFMAIDQYGHAYHGLENPRKDLCERLGRMHAEKMFIDGKDGQPRHVGYVVGGLWLRLYEVRPWYGDDFGKEVAE